MRRAFWTAAEVAIMREHYPTTRAKDIAGTLLPGRTVKQILYKAHRLGVKRTREAIAQMAREAIANPNHGGRASQFPKGLVPWNSGLTGWQAGGRSVETQFRPGTVSHNWVPVGSERCNNEGYIQRKMTDTGYPPHDWQAVHKVLWEQAHGPLPKGHIVIFIDGNNRNFALDNLQAISRADHMRRNSLHNLPKPVAELVQLRGALNRRINRLSKNHAERESS